MKSKIPIALILSNGVMTKWQSNALLEIEDIADVKVVLNCQNTRNRRNIFRNFLYYVIAFFSLRSFMTKSSAYTPGDEVVWVDFEGEHVGNWQVLPDAVVQVLVDRDVKLVVKFGMSLLKIMPNLKSIDIISYHHGNPEYYRGRPAGFYELLDGVDHSGVIVQILSNKLDAGKVLVLAKCKIVHHSYRKTAINFYTNSRFLLRKAVENWLSGKYLAVETLGKNYTLPSNAQASRFLVLLLTRKFQRLYYGMFVEKSWNVVTYEDAFSLKTDSVLSLENGRIAPIENKYSFIADPFYSADGRSLRVEAMDKQSGLGEIVKLDLDFSVVSVELQGEHYSYPFSIFDNGDEYLIPEVASHSSPSLYKFSEDQLEKTTITGLEDLRMVDASIFKHDQMFYLFGSQADSASDNLFLYYSENITGPYLAHPQNPIVIDPKCARMAGGFFCVDNKLLKFSQDNSFGYGNGISVSEVVMLTPSEYVEKLVSTIKFSSVCGPHTISIHDQKVAVDFYTENFTLFAGYRRLVAKLPRKIFQR